MEFKRKILFAILILFISVGFVSASDDLASYGDTSALGVDDANVLSEEDSSDLGLGADSLGSGDSSEESIDDEVHEDEEDFIDRWDYREFLGNSTDDDWDLENDSSSNSSYNPFVFGDASEIITSNLTKYDFNDVYKVKIVDDEGRAVFAGHVDFYVGRKFVQSSFVGIGGIASFNLNSAINTSGTYEIVSIYSDDDGSNSIMNRKSIEVGEIPIDERQAHIVFENILLYDLGETYTVRVVDINGNPVRKGFVTFIVYDRVIYSNLTDSGFASCVLPKDLNITGNLLVWSMYSDGELYDYADYEQITIGTRGLVSLDKSSIGNHIFTSWNNYSFVYADGQYVACIRNETYLVVDILGNVYLLYNHTAKNADDLNSLFKSLNKSSKYDVVQINLNPGATYSLGDTFAWEDKEWYYYARFTYGQLIINGNGATIEGYGYSNEYNNFLFVGSDANVYATNVTFKRFNHVFMNHGSLYCTDCVFRNNRAYRFEVKLEGSGAVVHNYNTAIFDNCGFYNNTAQFMGYGYTGMEGSILYAEPYSLNVFRDMYGSFRNDSFAACNFSTVVVYSDWMNWIDFKNSWFDYLSYFTIVDSEVIDRNGEWVVNVSTKDQLVSVFNTLNSYIPASSVVINLEPGNYVFEGSDYDRVRDYDFRYKLLEDAWIVVVNDTYLLEVGFAPVTINGNGATISIDGNDENDDFHFAFVGRYGSLTLNNLTVKKFNTAVIVEGALYANGVAFKDNVIDWMRGYGDVGGAIRSYGGTVICDSKVTFSGNRAGNKYNKEDEGIYRSDDIYADRSSYIELNGYYYVIDVYVNNSYVKGMFPTRDHIVFDGDSHFETIKSNSPAFAMFNVKDDASYQRIFKYLENNHPSSLLINFTGDYTFKFADEFNDNIAMTFVNNGYNVNFKTEEGNTGLLFKYKNAMTFVNFNFKGHNISNNASCSFVNCSFSGYSDEEYFILNDGSMTFTNCSFFNNNFDDSLILNHGTLSIFDSVFHDNYADDYGLVYNYGGSLMVMNTSFAERNCCHVYNFQSGNAVIGGAEETYCNVTFDEPWANWTEGLVKGLFLVGTAALTFGAGAGIAVVLPGVAGLVVSSIAGAGIGFACGIGYGAIEGYMYHDYSGIWMHGLSHAIIGMSMAQAGFQFNGKFIENTRDAFNEIRGEGAGEGAGPGGAGEGGAGADAPIAPENPAPQHGAAKDIEGLLENVISDLEYMSDRLGARFADLVTNVQNHVTAIVSGGEISYAALINVYSEIHSILAAHDALNAPEQNAIEKVVDRLDINNLINNEPIISNVEEPPLLNNEPGNQMVDNVVSQNDFLRNAINQNPDLDYLIGRINVDTFNIAAQNQAYALRALTLLTNFADLARRVRSLTANQIENNLDSYVNLYNNAIGRRSSPRIINDLFNPNAFVSTNGSSHMTVLESWETIYQHALDDYNKVMNSSGLDKDIVDDKANNVTAVLKTRIPALIDKMKNKFEAGTANAQKYSSLKDDWNRWTDAASMDELLKIYNGLVDLDNVVIDNTDNNRYQQLIAFDYAAFINDNPINGLFNRPDYVMNTNVYSVPKVEMLNDLQMLKSFNATLYNKILSEVFNGADLEEWTNNAKPDDYKNMYKQIHDYLVNNNYIEEMDEDAFNFYIITKLMKTPGSIRDLYPTLSDPLKMMVNKYIYEESCELLKTFNGVYYMHGVWDFQKELNKLKNYGNLTVDYIRELITVYEALHSSRGMENIFNRDLTGLSSDSIRDILLLDIKAFAQMHHQFIKRYGDIKKDYVESYIPQVIDWAQKDLKENLTNLYNQFKYVHDQLCIFYKLDYCLHKNLPLDIELYKQLNHIGIAREDWSNDLGHKVSVIFGNVLDNQILNLIKNQFNNLLPYASVDVPVVDPNAQGEELIKQRNAREVALREQQRRSNIIYMQVYNRYLELSKNPKIDMSNMSLIDMMIIEGTNLYGFNQVYDAEYYKNITAKTMGDGEIRDLFDNMDIEGQKTLRDIDVSHIESNIKAFQNACPVGYSMLREYFTERYGKYTFGGPKWEYVEGKKYDQFCIKTVNGIVVTYSDFCDEIRNQMKSILNSLGVLGENNIIRFYSPNYTLGNVFSLNPYDNVFNRIQYYESLKSWDEEEIPSVYENMFNEIEMQLDIIKSVNQELYESIMRDYFDGASSFNIWYNSIPIDDPDDEYDDDYKDESIRINVFISKYKEIFNKLGQFRNNTYIMEHELDILLPQLDDVDFQNMDGDFRDSLRSRMLYSIYFWQFAHKLASDNYYAEMDRGNPEFTPFIPFIGHMDLKLMNMPVEELLDLYKAFVYQTSYSIFEEEYNFNDMSVNGVQSVLINNMYRAFYCSNTSGWVFDILKNNNIPCDNFNEFQNHVLSIKDKQALVDLYNLIHNNAEIPKNNPNPNDVDKVKEIIMDKTIPDTDPNVIYKDGEEDASYFMGSWNLIVKNYPAIANVILNNLMRGNLNNYVALQNNADYNKVRANILRFLVDYYSANVPVDGGNVPVDGGDVPVDGGVPAISGFIISRAELDDIASIMRNMSIQYEPELYDEQDMDLCNLTGSWMELDSKYPLVAKYIQKYLFGEKYSFKFEDYVLGTYDFEHWNQFREDLIKFLEDHYKNKIELNENQFYEIKKAMEDTTRESRDGHGVLGDIEGRLWGSWEFVEDNYPGIASFVSRNLFNGDLIGYANSVSDRSVNFMRARLNILDFIRKNFVNKDEGGNSSESPINGTINGKPLAEWTVDELNWMVQNEIIAANLDPVMAQSLLNELESNYYAYLQLLDLISSSGLPSENYKHMIDRFKNDIYEIWKQIEPNKPSVKGLHDIESIMNKKDWVIDNYVDISDDEFAIQKIMLNASFKKIAADYPDFAKAVLEKLYLNDPTLIIITASLDGADFVRQQIIDFAKEYFSKNNVAPQGQNTDIYMIPQENLNGANLQQIEAAMARASNTAVGFANQIKAKDSQLGQTLEDKISMIYAMYLSRLNNNNPQLQYFNYIKELNYLFKDLKPSDYLVENGNDKGIIIKKDSTSNLTNDKFKALMKKALDNSDDKVKVINKTNPKLADRIYKKSHQVYDDYIDRVINKGGNGRLLYDDFISILNGLFTEPIAPNVQPKVEDSKASNLTNEELLNKIKQKLSSGNSKLRLPEILHGRYAELSKATNPNRQDLLDLLDDVTRAKENLLKADFTQRVIFGKQVLFDEKKYATAKISKVRSLMRGELDQIHHSFPNLYNSLKKLFGTELKNKSLEELQQLRNRYRDYSTEYFKLLKTDSKWLNELKNEYSKNRYLDNVFITYFNTDGAELGFTKNLQGQTSTAIRDYIINEMTRIENTNLDLYKYYIDTYFNGKKNVRDYFRNMENNLSPEQWDIAYQSFYYKIHKDVELSRSLLKELSEFYYEFSKYDTYIESIENSTGIKLDGKKAEATKTYLKAILNIKNPKLKNQLYRLLVGGLAKDGSLDPGNKDEIQRLIFQIVGIQVNHMDDAEFEILTGLMNHNVHNEMRALLLSRYVKIINEKYSSNNTDYKMDYEYNRIYFEYLTYRATFVNRVYFFNEELQVLNNLKSLNSFDIVNKILEKKLLYKNRQRNIVAEGIVDEILNGNVINSLEYQVLTNGNQIDIANLNHISIYYRVFTHPNNLPNNLADLIQEVQSEMDAIKAENSPLHDSIMRTHFSNANRVEDAILNMGATDDERLKALKDIYKRIYDELGKMRDNNIVNTIWELKNNGA